MNGKKYIFILGHMRCYSTLLSHILASHSEICGYSEMHQPYYSAIDLQNLKFNAKERYGIDSGKRFILDKILHNIHEISESILRNEQVYPVFLVRNPLDSLKSIIELRSQPDSKNKRNDETAVANYYINRLEKLIEYSNLKRGKNLFISSEDIMNNTDKTLNLLSDFLNLKEKLTSDYKTFEFTGIDEYGDTSEYINEGKIIKDRAEYNTIISNKCRNECEIVYEKCTKVLSSNSIKIDK